jgi:glutamyl-tRNA reductase
MALAVVGISHHTAPVEVRERFAFGESEGMEIIRELRTATGVEEVVLLSTCNRTEVYLHPVEGEGVFRELEALLQRRAAPLPAPASEFLYRREGDSVPGHLFRVISGLDSLVVGEAEIQGQVQTAYQRSAEADLDPPLAGPVLNRLFQTAFSVGGRVRSETAIGDGAASVASVAVALARKIFGPLKGRRVLVLGAGETSRLVVEALGRSGVSDILVANRTYERAADLAQRLAGRAVELEEIGKALSDIDIVVASTSAPHALISRRTLVEAFPSGLNRPLLLMDIAVPRDVDPAVAKEAQVFLYNVDDLRKIVDETLDRRRDAMAQAETIIEASASEFRAWQSSLRIVPILRSIRARGEEIRAAELDRVLSRLAHLDEVERAAVEEFGRRLMNKLLHEPTVRLREGAANGRALQAIQAAEMLFGPPGTPLASEEEGAPAPGDAGPTPPGGVTEEETLEGGGE